jgi:hypothetical protein
VLVGFGILGTFGPSPGSFEGLIYTQLLRLSWLAFYWVNHPEKRWLTWLLVVLFFLVLLFSILGLLFAR